MALIKSQLSTHIHELMFFIFYFITVGIFTEGFKDIAFTNYSETWKLHRKLAFSSLR